MVTSLDIRNEYLKKIEEDIRNQLDKNNKKIFLLGQYDYSKVSGAILTDYLYSKMRQKITSNSDFVFCMLIFLKMNNGRTIDEIWSYLEEDMNKQQELPNYKITTQNKVLIKKKINNTLKFIKENGISNLNVSDTVYDILKYYVMLDIKTSHFDDGFDLLFTFAMVQIFKRMPKEETESWKYIEKELKSTYLIKEKNFISEFKDFKITQSLRDKKIRPKILNTIKTLHEKYNLYYDEKSQDIDDILKSQCFLTEKNYEKYFEFIQEYYRRNIYDENTKYTGDDVKSIQILAKAYIDAKEDKNNTNNESRNLVVNKLNDECLRRTLANADIQDLIKYVGEKHIRLYELCVDNYNNIDKIIQKYKLGYFQKKLCEWCKDNIPTKIKENSHKSMHLDRSRTTDQSPYMFYSADEDCFKIIIPKQKIYGEAEILSIILKFGEKEIKHDMRRGMGFTQKLGYFNIEKNIELNIDPNDIFKKFIVEMCSEESGLVYSKEIPARKYRFFGEKEEKDIATIRKNGCRECYLICQKNIKVELDDNEDIIEELPEYDLYDLDISDSNFKITINSTQYHATRILEDKTKSYDIHYNNKNNQLPYDIVPVEDDGIKRKLTLSHPIIFIDKDSEELKNYKGLWLYKVLGKEENEDAFYKIELDKFPLQKDDNGREFYEIDVEKYINKDSNMQKAQSFKENEREYCLCWDKKNKTKPLNNEYYILIGKLDEETGKRIDPYGFEFNDLYVNEEEAIISSEKEKYLQLNSDNIKRPSKEHKERFSLSDKRNYYICKLSETDNSFRFNTSIYNYRIAESEEYVEDDKREQFFYLELSLNVLKYSFDGNLNVPHWHRVKHNYSTDEIRDNLENSGHEDGDESIYLKFEGEAVNLKLYFKNKTMLFDLPEKAYRVFSMVKLYNILTDNVNFSGSVYIDFNRSNKHYHEKLFSIGEEKKQVVFISKKEQIPHKTNYKNILITKMKLNNEDVKPYNNHLITNIHSEDGENFAGDLKLVQNINRQKREKLYAIDFIFLDSKTFNDDSLILNIKAKNGNLCYNRIGRDVNLLVTDLPYENNILEQGIWVSARYDNDIQEDY